MTDKELEKLWSDFGDIPINDDNDEEIEQDFHIWKKGTDRFEIWYWFDEHHTKGLAKGLMKI